MAYGAAFDYSYGRQASLLLVYRRIFAWEGICYGGPSRFSSSR